MLPADKQGLALCALPLAILYPYMKRLTHAAQVFLGLTFNWSVLIGWAVDRAALMEPLPFACYLLYISAALWTIAYDTVYAIQDCQDDRALGLKSTAVFFGHRSLFFACLCTICSGLGVCVCVWLQKHNIIVTLLIAGAWFVNFYWLYGMCQEPQMYQRYFLRQGWFGGIVFAFLCLIYFL